MDRSGDTDERQLRVDFAHSARLSANQECIGRSKSHEVMAAIAGHASHSAHADATSECLLQHHADSLGEQLRIRYYELARREEEFNTRAAHVENELRTARLVIREREYELTERREEFDSSLRRLREQNADLVAATAALEAETSETTTSLRKRSKGTIQSAELWQRRLKELDRDERKLKAKMADNDQRQLRLDALEKRLTEESRRLKEATAQVRADNQKKLETRTNKLNRQADKLEKRRLAVERLHQDVTRMYKEAIEIQICTEEIWAQMNDVSPAELTEKMLRLRRKLTDQYELSNQQLHEQRIEIEALVKRLQQHESKLSNQRSELRGWISRRQREMEEQARELSEREQRLDKQSANMQHSEHHWQSERDRLEQEVRRLKRLS